MDDDGGFMEAKLGIIELVAGAPDWPSLERALRSAGSVVAKTGGQIEGLGDERRPDSVKVKFSQPGSWREWRVLETGKCSSCGATIYWCQTHKDKRAPVDVMPDDKGMHETHFATCPKAGDFRK